MNKNIILSILFLTNVYFAVAQTPPPQPTPSKEDVQQRALEAGRQQAEMEQRRRAQMEQKNARSSIPVVNNIRREPPPVYRKATKEEMAVITPDQSDLEKYADFLRQPKTGLIKLVAELGCLDNNKVIIATADCIKYAVLPGAGASYSFRIREHRHKQLADLTFINDNFKSLGTLVQGVLVAIGDVPLADVTLQTKGLKFLTDIQPNNTSEQAEKDVKLFARGVLVDNFIYRSELRAMDDMTYVLRSIAYDGEIFRASESGYVINASKYDTRKDITVAFRIVRRSPEDGSLTILWKELAIKDSPEIKGKTNKPAKGEKENNFTVKEFTGK